jgi:hypothetical protein
MPEFDFASGVQPVVGTQLCMRSEQKVNLKELLHQGNTVDELT